MVPRIAVEFALIGAGVADVKLAGAALPEETCVSGIAKVAAHSLPAYQVESVMDRLERLCQIMIDREGV